MKTVTCTNETCPENDVQEHMCGDPDYVMCGVCHEPCALSELYDDPESCNARMGEP
jgi:hypothetical protein